jgi:hypothetical protein
MAGIVKKVRKHAFEAFKAGPTLPDLLIILNFDGMESNVRRYWDE